MSARMERKVRAASLATLAAAFATSWVVDKVPGLSDVAVPLQAVIVGALSSASAAAAGWFTKHTPDL
ncbi:hypothetical protein [Actinomadura atramentaria]|uniref:hypothetical protein n=1 Tax=Actinomadura atramentaria TaxID=1990 RepID=UPI0003A5A107|nr:hypothetical protein [Actinomadura atramentaria]